MTRHDHLPSSQPERTQEEQSLSIWKEVLKSSDALRGSPFLDPVESEESWLQGNEKEAQLAQGFQRGRAILQTVAYGHSYWEIETGLGLITLDEEATADLHPGVQEAFKRLIQLVILSRAALSDHDGWRLPDGHELIQIKEQIKDELGLMHAHEALVREYTEAGRTKEVFGIPDFLGCDDKMFVDAILSGQVRVGNPEDPEAENLTPAG